jgi:hypothetical protein
MADTLFQNVGFDDSLNDQFERIREFIETPAGCNASVYKPDNMHQARAAHIPPGVKGRKKAQQVFAEIRPRRNAIQVARRRTPRKRNPGARWQFWVDRGFNEWDALEKALKEWSLDPKPPKKPKAQYDYGDGVALPGGLPETNHAKF